MKVLWFSNCALSKATSSGSGSWLFAMRDLIAKDVELVNVTEDAISEITERKGNGIKEYLLPQWKLQEGVPSDNNIKKIASIVTSESPDVIHVWGVEKYWALLFSRGYIEFDNVILEMQGVLSACVDVYYGGLAPKDCLKQISLKSTMFGKYRLGKTYRLFQKKALLEEELIKSFKNIAVQSVWTKEQLATICNEKTNYYYSLRPIRQEFYKAEKWSQKKSDYPVLFCSVSYYKPFKGIHFLLKAVNLLCKQHPKMVLRIAGPNLGGRPFYYNSDYERFVLKEIKNLGIERNVQFCGSLNAEQVVKEIHNANVVVNPSLVESYSAAAAEALYLGAPTVLAYAGAMVNFSDDKPVALYYSPMDYRGLASKVSILLTDERLRLTLVSNSIEIMSKLCSPDRVRTRQLETYSFICKCR